LDLVRRDRDENITHGLDTETVWRCMTLAKSAGTVTGSEPWPGRLLGVAKSLVLTPVDEKQYLQKLHADCYPGSTPGSILISPRVSLYCRLAFGREVWGSIDASLKSTARFALVCKNNRLVPVEVQRFVQLTVTRQRSDNNFTDVNHIFAEVKWFECKTRKGPEGKYSIWYTYHFERTELWQRLVPVQRLAQRFAPAYSDDGFTFFVCPLPRRVHV
jgi:hypothetical protein